MAEQLGWRAPDHCIVPMASGSLYVKIWKGLQELVKLGLIDSLHTKMSGAQAAGCSPIVTAWEAGTLNVRPVRPQTIAKSLAIGNPADGYYALQTLAEEGNYGVAVSDEEVVEGMLLLARTEGIFAETAGGVVVSGLKRLVEAGRVGRDEVVVAYITGAGLKTQEAVAEAVAPPLLIEPNIASFERVLGERQELEAQPTDVAS